MKSFADELKNMGEIDEGMLEKVNLYEDQMVLQKGKRQRNIRRKHALTMGSGGYTKKGLTNKKEGYMIKIKK